MLSEPRRMSTFEEVEPKRTGVPGLTSWVSTSPASSSAVCMASMPASETGAVVPPMASAAMITGWRAFAYTSSTSSMSLA